MADVAIDGGAGKTVFQHGLLEGIDGVHALVGIDAVEADDFIGVGLHGLQDAVVGRSGLGDGFAVTAVHDELDAAQALGQLHFFGQGRGGAAAKAGLGHKAAEHGVVQDGIDNGLDAGTETKIDEFHDVLWIKG